MLKELTELIFSGIEGRLQTEKRIPYLHRSRIEVRILGFCYLALCFDKKIAAIGVMPFTNAASTPESEPRYVRPIAGHTP